MSRIAVGGNPAFSERSSTKSCYLITNFLNDTFLM